jgi:hypothetical protein
MREYGFVSNYGSGPNGSHEKLGKIMFQLLKEPNNLTLRSKLVLAEVRDTVTSKISKLY